jgi:hypothetical protein
MDLRELERIEPMTVDFHGLSVTFNPDAFTPGFYFAAAERFKTRFGESLAEIEQAVNRSGKGRKQKRRSTSIQNAQEQIEQIAQHLRQPGENVEAEREFYISLLVGEPDWPVLLSWDLTNDGQAVQCNAEGLRTFKKIQTLRGLWETVRDAPLPKSQGIATIPQSQTTSENTQSPSASPGIPAEDSPVM